MKRWSKLEVLTLPALCGVELVESSGSRLSERLSNFQGELKAS